MQSAEGVVPKTFDLLDGQEPGAGRELVLDGLPAPAAMPAGRAEAATHAGALGYRAEVDGLRAVAVLPVILYHAGFGAFGGGFVGVDVFFVISGYLITTILVSELQEGRFSLVNFYERRARRILPALFCVMFACLPLAWLWLLPADMKSFSQSLVAVSGFASNLLFWQTSGYFDSAAELKPLLHTWSLAVEEQYYVFFPLLLMLLWRLGRSRVLALLALAAILSLALAQMRVQADPAATFYLLPTRGWELLLGAFLAFHFSRQTPPGTGSAATWLESSLGRQLGAGLGLLLIAYGVFAFDKQTPFPSLYALVPTLGAALIILCASRETLVGRLLGSRLCAGIGLISYSAYLWHQPLIAFTKHASLEEPGKPLLGAVAAASLVLAYFSWRYVETPFRDKRRFSRRQIFGLGAAGSALFVAIGLAGHFSNGFSVPYRYAPADQQLVEANLPSATDYVPRHFNELRERAFDAADPRRKILIVGDSYAQDLVNALFEAGLAGGLQISTRHIGKECGNLFLPAPALQAHVAPEAVAGCKERWIYADTALRQRMLAADEIWFASSWQPWQAALIAGSVANVGEFAQKPVRVFGRKNFGEFRLRQLVLMDKAELPAYRNRVPDFQIQVNETMGRSLAADVFVDVQRLLCGDRSDSCALFTREGALVTFDGTHLTRQGARFYGEQLARYGPLGLAGR